MSLDTKALANFIYAKSIEIEKTEDQVEKAILEVNARRSIETMIDELEAKEKNSKVKFKKEQKNV
jgi:hypothetical protein